MRILVAGFGNPLMGDDGFGVAVVENLAEAIRDPDVTIKSVGSSGLELVHELMSGYDALIIVDAIAAGEPGDVYLVDLELDSEGEVAEIDPHILTPRKALIVAKKLGILPKKVYMVGTRPLILEEAYYELSEPVYRAVKKAVELILRILYCIKNGHGVIKSGGCSS